MTEGGCSIDKDQKTERATDKRRKDERKKGNVFTSKDVINLVSILVTFVGLQVYFPYMTSFLSTSILTSFSNMVAYDHFTASIALQILRDSCITVAIVYLPIAIVNILASVIAAGAQTRFLFSMESLKPKFSRLNPLQGIKRMISLSALVEIGKGLLKITVIIAIIYNFFITRLSDFVRTISLDISLSARVILEMIMSLIYNVCMYFVVVAAIDFVFQWWNYEKNIRMTKQEIKEEYKQIEGDPKVKAKIKERQRKLAMQRMMQAVPTADVVIRNPTHYAVAMKYDIDNDVAPVVVAKGIDEVALRIVSIAQLNDVYVMEDPELTRAVFAAAEIDDAIPPEFYAAVAEILAMVYQIKEKQI